MCEIGIGFGLFLMAIGFFGYGLNLQETRILTKVGSCYEQNITFNNCIKLHNWEYSHGK